MEQLSYWCTWSTQNSIAIRAWDGWVPGKLAFLGTMGASAPRDIMNEQSLFGEDGFLKLYPQIRKDLFFMVDDGWDVPYGAGATQCRKEFGSLELDTDRFPSIHGTPQERLKILSDRVKTAGWKGLGIWIAAQRPGDDYEAPFSDADKDYWRTRILWSKFADVRYWKVDWGTQTYNNDFRQFLTEAAAALYPELAVEHATCVSPVNGRQEEVLAGVAAHFADDTWICSKAESILPFSTVFRTYDVLPALSVATTFDRVAHYLPLATGYLNVEDEVYLGAALGCQLGIMRSKFSIGIQPENDRLDEPVAAVKWQRYAPPFLGTKAVCSEHNLVDTYSFEADETWFAAFNQHTVHQSAPAVLARNTMLPTVSGGERLPFVAASRHPNGGYSLCVLPRNEGRISKYVGGSIFCTVAGRPERISVFGRLDELTIDFNEPTPISRLVAQSLLDDTQEDITGDVEMTARGFRVSGDRLAALWHTQDQSAPAIMLLISYES